MHQEDAIRDRENGKGTGLGGPSVFAGNEVGWDEDKISPPAGRSAPEPTFYRLVMKESWAEQEVSCWKVLRPCVPSSSCLNTAWDGFATPSLARAKWDCRTNSTRTIAVVCISWSCKGAWPEILH